MAGDQPEEKASRRKRRVPGTDKPPRKAFCLRLEESTFDRLNKMLTGYKCSRNEYVESLILFDLEYQERLRALNDPSPPPDIKIATDLQIKDTVDA
jgi:hypothetical protein